MKRFCIILIIFLFVVGVRAEGDKDILDNLYMSVGAGFLIGDNGQPSSISNVATAWDANVGYWFGDTKYTGARLGYMGNVLYSFNYSGRNGYGWNSVYVDGLLNVSNLIYKPHKTDKDPLWYCALFVSVGCFVPMAQNSYKTSLGLGVGLANEFNVHKNISITLDWRNTLACTSGIKWLPEVSAGVKIYFTGKARIKKMIEISSPHNTIFDCVEQEDSIKTLKIQNRYLDSQIDSLNKRIAIMESDTSIYHFEDKAITDYIFMVRKLPYNDRRVNRAITLIPMIKDANISGDYQSTLIQLNGYYNYVNSLYEILLKRQKQLGSETFNKSMWKKAFGKEINEFEANKDQFNQLFYITDLIKKVKEEIIKENPDFSDIIEELNKALKTKK